MRDNWNIGQMSAISKITANREEKTLKQSKKANTVRRL